MSARVQAKSVVGAKRKAEAEVTSGGASRPAVGLVQYTGSSSDDDDDQANAPSLRHSHASVVAPKIASKPKQGAAPKSRSGEHRRPRTQDPGLIEPMNALPADFFDDQTDAPWESENPLDNKPSAEGPDYPLPLPLSTPGVAGNAKQKPETGVSATQGKEALPKNFFSSHGGGKDLEAQIAEFEEAIADDLDSAEKVGDADAFFAVMHAEREQEEEMKQTALIKRLRGLREQVIDPRAEQEEGKDDILEYFAGQSESFEAGAATTGPANPNGPDPDSSDDEDDDGDDGDGDEGLNWRARVL